MSAATRKKISDALKRYYATHPRKRRTSSRRRHRKSWADRHARRAVLHKGRKPKVRHPYVRHPRVRHPRRSGKLTARRKPSSIRYRPPRARLRKLSVHVRRPRAGTLRQLVTSRYQGKRPRKSPKIL